MVRIRTRGGVTASGGNRIEFKLDRNIPADSGVRQRKLVSFRTAQKLRDAHSLTANFKSVSAERRRDGRAPVLPLGVAVENAWALVSEQQKSALFEGRTPEERAFFEISKIRIIFQNPKARAELFRTLRHYTDEKTFSGRLRQHDARVREIFGDRQFEMADVGCSSGETTEDSVRAFPNARIVGYDSFFPLGFSKEGKRAEYREHDILKGRLPLQVDCIRFVNVNPHLTIKGKAVARKNLSASLKEGGILLSNDYVPDGEDSVKITRVYRKKGRSLVFLQEFHDRF